MLLALDSWLSYTVENVWEFFRTDLKLVVCLVEMVVKAGLTAYIDRVHTGHEKPEKQVFFVKSHERSHENFKKLTNVMKVVMKKKKIYR